MFNDSDRKLRVMSRAAARRPGGRGAGLTQEQIVNAAIQLLDDAGLDALTIRGLARSLDVEPAALYWHFPNKDEICRAVIAQISAQLHVDTTRRGSPREQLQQHLSAIRAHWRRHPSALELGRRFLPTVDSEVTRAGLDLLVELGVPTNNAIDRYRILTWSVMGFVIIEQTLPSSVHHHRADATGNRWVLRLEGSTESSEFDTDILFQSTITQLLDGLQAAATPTTPPPT